MSLKRYKQKRDFKKTPEPSGRKEQSAKSLPVFVVQKHSATRLHFDFRIEHQGVLKSWAIPKQPSNDVDVKRLAIHVEDHPLAYGKFSGTIPEGEYGAGKVEIWDHGTYTYPGLSERRQIDEMIKRGFKKQHLVLELHGKRLKGKYSLIKFTTEKKDSWLFFKMKDDFAFEEDVIIDNTRLGKIVEEAAREGKSVKSFPQMKPMLATLVNKPFSKKGWVFEIKLDGYRALASLIGKEINLMSRNGIKLNDDYTEIIDSLRKLQFKCILDGEICVVDEQGISKLGLLQQYKKTGKGQLVYFVFDLLYLEGYDLRECSLDFRKKLLKALIPDLHNVVYLDHIEKNGEKFFEIAKKENLEGIIAKKMNSKYESAKRSANWQKIKVSQELELYVAGYTDSHAGPFGALVLAQKSGDKFQYMGRVGSGFTKLEQKKIFELITKNKMQVPPAGIDTKTDPDAIWVKPQLKCRVRITEITNEGRLRHPVYIGLCERRKFIQKEKAVSKIIEGHEVKITHPDKIYWPKHNYTKADMLDYYLAVSGMMVPYLKDRPITMRRFPEGVEQAGFFYKDFDDEHPSWIKTYKVPSESAGKVVDYFLCNNAAALLFMANLGTVEIHPWHSRVGSIDNPDYFVFDLDPHEVPYFALIKCALTLRHLLDELKIPSFIKTSGFLGLHIYVPLAAKYSYDQALRFGDIISAIINDRLPDITSRERSPEKRPHKIYLDILQNRKGQTIVAPYSIRPGKDATVSTPLHWEEVENKLNPAAFTIKTVLKRFEKEGDLWKGVLGKGIDLKTILKSLESILEEKR